MNGRRLTHAVFRADAHSAVLLIRLAVAVTFLVAGARKFMDPERTGENFANIGFPAAQALATMVGTFELLCGILVLVGLATRAAAVPLMVIMLVALIATKLPILVGGPVGPFSGPSGSTGLMPFLNQSRLDLTMLFAATFLLLVGAGRISLDARVWPWLALRGHQLRDTRTQRI